jgi:hypothetical protein
MKIYPDPELPDIDVEWYDGDCSIDNSSILLALTSVEDPAVHFERTVACSDVKSTFKDVPRHRYKLRGALLDDNGDEFNSYDEELDLRNGIDETAYMYFGGFGSNFRVAWTFDMGATCASLGADGVQIDFTIAGEIFYAIGTSCEETPYVTSVTNGTYSVIVRAIAGTETLAASAEIPDVTIGFDSLTNLGTVVLTPCGAACP